MHAPLISVIIPVYNVEKYLNKCVESVVNQTYKNLEIILVDDGSPDHCPHMCDDWAQKDARIKVIHKQNGGVSSARNVGLAVATGRYVAFVDPDDWLDVEAYDCLIQMMQPNSMVVFNTWLYSENQYTKIFRFDTDKIVGSNEILYKVVRTDLGGSCWNKLYDLAVIKKFGIQFDITLKVAEDYDFFYEYSKKIDRVFLTNEPYYFYRMHSESVTNSHCLAYYERYQENEKMLKEASNARVYKAALRGLVSMLYNIVCEMIDIKDRHLLQVRKKIIQKFRKYLFEYYIKVTHKVSKKWVLLAFNSCLFTIYIRGVTKKS